MRIPTADQVSEAGNVYDSWNKPNSPNLSFISEINRALADTLEMAKIRGYVHDLHVVYLICIAFLWDRCGTKYSGSLYLLLTTVCLSLHDTETNLGQRHCNSHKIYTP